jgi:hypothetical protein
MSSLVHLNETETIRWILVILSIQVILTSAELLGHLPIYGAGGLLSWKYIKPSKKSFVEGWMSGRVFELFFSIPGIVTLNCLRLILALALLAIIRAGAPETYMTGAILGITLSTLLLTVRNVYSNNGADQLLLIILIALCISRIGPAGGPIRFLSILFVGCQSTLSYFTSGFFKLLQPNWRNGTSLRDILSTGTFGHPLLKRLMDSIPLAYKTGSAVVIYGEMLLGLCFFLPPGFAVFLLMGGVLFHFAVAVTMGLNTFFWAFLATYPAVYFVCLSFH